MSIQNYTFALIVLTCVRTGFGQSTPERRPDRHSDIQRQTPVSETYSDTIRLLKEWLEKDSENRQTAQLFSVGDTRAVDLLTACREEEDEVSSAAFFAVQLLGLDDGTCSASIRQKRDALVLSTPSGVTEADFRAIDQWLSKRRTGTTYNCGDDDEQAIDDALVYALALEGSVLSRSALRQLLAFEKSCGGLETFLSKALWGPATQALLGKARGRNLSINPNALESSIRNSAFFLPTEHGGNIKVKLLAHNLRHDRILVDVSYRCGMLCGRGYYVVLRKAGIGWEYAVITMIWIS